MLAEVFRICLVCDQTLTPYAARIRAPIRRRAPPYRMGAAAPVRWILSAAIFRQNAPSGPFLFSVHTAELSGGIGAKLFQYGAAGKACGEMATCIYTNAWRPCRQTGEEQERLQYREHGTGTAGTGKRLRHCYGALCAVLRGGGRGSVTLSDRTGGGCKRAELSGIFKIISRLARAAAVFRRQPLTV